MRPGQCSQPEGVLRSTQEGLRSTQKGDAVNPGGVNLRECGQPGAARSRALTKSAGAAREEGGRPEAGQRGFQSGNKQDAERERERMIRRW